jgi:hypothetical protein
MKNSEIISYIFEFKLTRLWNRVIFIFKIHIVTESRPLIMHFQSSFGINMTKWFRKLIATLSVYLFWYWKCIGFSFFITYATYSVFFSVLINFLTFSNFINVLIGKISPKRNKRHIYFIKSEFKALKKNL